MLQFKMEKTELISFYIYLNVTIKLLLVLHLVIFILTFLYNLIYFLKRNNCIYYYELVLKKYFIYTYSKHCETTYSNVILKSSL